MRKLSARKHFLQCFGESNLGLIPVSSAPQVVDHPYRIGGIRFPIPDCTSQRGRPPFLFECTGFDSLDRKPRLTLDFQHRAPNGFALQGNQPDLQTSNTLPCPVQPLLRQDQFQFANQKSQFRSQHKLSLLQNNLLTCTREQLVHEFHIDQRLMGYDGIYGQVHFRRVVQSIQRSPHAGDELGPKT